MLEGLTQRYIRTNSDGHFDPVVTFQNLFGDPRSSHELPVDAYLDSLSNPDRSHVEHFVNFARTLRFTPNGPHLASVIAVGSTTRFENERHHPPEDIDLRILNSAPSKGTNLREHMVDYIKDSVKGYLQTSGIDFQEYNQTVLNKMIWQYENGRKILGSYLDWYNNDPSFVATHSEGLPLHLSISGVNTPLTDEYLRLEREHNGHFALLYKS